MEQVWLDWRRGRVEKKGRREKSRRGEGEEKRAGKIVPCRGDGRKELGEIEFILDMKTENLRA